jgi:hypothetical protein
VPQSLRFLQQPFNWQTWQTKLRAAKAQDTRMRQLQKWRVRMVAVVRNLPIAPTIRFEIPIVESAA